MRRDNRPLQRAAAAFLIALPYSIFNYAYRSCNYHLLFYNMPHFPSISFKARPYGRGSEAYHRIERPCIHARPMCSCRKAEQEQVGSQPASVQVSHPPFGRDVFSQHLKKWVEKPFLSHFFFAVFALFHAAMRLFWYVSSAPLVDSRVHHSEQVPGIPDPGRGPQGDPGPNFRKFHGNSAAVVGASMSPSAEHINPEHEPREQSFPPRKGGDINPSHSRRSRRIWLVSTTSAQC